VGRKLRKTQAEAGDIVLLFSDESEAPPHSYLARVPNPANPATP